MSVLAETTMTAYELSYLAYETEVFIEAIFNRWIQATFAVLVATWLAGARLNILFLKLMGALYLAFSLAQLSTFLFQISKLIDYIVQLERIIDDYAGNVFLSAPGGLLSLFIYVIGTWATLYFVRYTYKQSAEHETP